MAVQTLTSNRDIDYIQKDFDSVTDAVITFANVNFGPGTSANRLWTNFNADSFSRTWLEIVSFVSDVFFFYFDVQSTQSYLQTATIRSAVKDIASQFGFSPATASSASGDAVFTTTAAGTVPRGFRVSSASGVEFFVTNDIVAGAAGEYTGTVLQGSIKTETFSAEGVQNEEINLAGPNVIVDLDNLNPLDITPQVTVQGNTYTLVESFIRHPGTDTPAITDSLGNVIGGGRVFVLGERPNGAPFIRFGDGIFGRKLQPNEGVTVTYRTGGGTQGNIDEETLVSLTDSLPFVASVINNSKFSGGADEQTIEQLRQLIPASLRTLERAVAATDYSDIIVANFSEVFAASTEPNKVDPGVDLNIYVVPQGSGITNITENTLLLNKLNNFIDIRKMVTVQFQILDAFGVDTLITLEVFISSTASKTTVQQAIETALTGYFDLSTGGPEGDGVGFAEPILLKDISSLIQEIDGIDRFEIKKLSYRPRIAKNIQGLVTDYNSSEVDIFSNVTESEWLLAASGLVSEASGAVIFDNGTPEGFTYDISTGKVTYDSAVDLSGVGPGDLFRNGPGQQEVVEVQTVGDGAGQAEITKITTVADQQGIQEKSQIDCVADVAGSLGGTFFIIYDDSGAVAVWFDVDNGNSQPSTGANRNIEVDISANDGAAAVATALQGELDADSKFSASIPGGFPARVEVTMAVPLDVFDTADGSVPTDFDFTTLVQGETPDELDGTYFVLYDDSGSVAFWFDVSGTTTIPSGAAAEDRAVEISTVAANDPANDVASKVQAVVNADAKFSASVSTNEVTVTDASVGDRDDGADGIPPTGFTIEVETQGADAVSIGGTYFILPDINGAIAVWYDVDNGDTEPAHGLNRSIEVDISLGDDEDTVATETDTALSAGIAEITDIFTVADISGTLNDTYFFLNAADDVTEYYVWYNVSGGGTDPSLVGKTGIEVAISTNDDANAVALATQTEIDLIGDFNAGVTGNKVTVTNDDGGACTDASDSVSPTNTGFTFDVTTQGATFFVAKASNVLTITANDKAEIIDASDGLVPTGFTIKVLTQGVADDTDFIIFSVDIEDSVLYILENQPVNAVGEILGGGSVRNGSTSFESFKCFKKTLAVATNLSIDSITDSNLDLSVRLGTGAVLGARILIDNSQVFIPGELATGEYYLVDGAGNIWEIEDNSSNTITTSVTAVNDASITNVSAGDYKVVVKLIGSQIVFNNSIFNIQFNSDNTIFSVGAQFTQIGTIGDSFEISEEQSQTGNLGVPVDLIAFNTSNGEIRLNGSPDLEGINSGNVLIDADGSTFNIIAVDNRSLPQVSYGESNQNDNLILTGTGLGVQYAQGFQVTETDTYAIVSFNLKREGNIIGNLTARVLGDDGSGLPDITNVIANSRSVSIPTVSDSSYERVVFSFTSPPTLNAGVQYHLVLAGDTSYAAAQQDDVTTFNNTGPETYTWDSVGGVIQYNGVVDLSSVLPGHFFQDNDGTLFQITVVDDDNDSLTLSPGLAVIVGTAASGGRNGGSAVANDNIRLAVDNSSPTFATGELSRFNGAAWSNSTTGPDQFTSEHDAIFSVEGPKTIRVDSNLSPALGTGATISERYYDDDRQISFVLGLSDGSITSATDVTATGRGTVGGVPDTLVDHFIFRTSRFADDIVNLRANEIPQIQVSDIQINLFGGVS